MCCCGQCGTPAGYRGLGHYASLFRAPLVLSFAIACYLESLSRAIAAAAAPLPRGCAPREGRAGGDKPPPARAHSAPPLLSAAPLAALKKSSKAVAATRLRTSAAGRRPLWAAAENVSARMGGEHSVGARAG